MNMPEYMRVRLYLYNLRSKSDGKELQIPSENVLCRMFDVSRVTVRSAIQGLIRDKYLIPRRGIGTFINTSTPLDKFLNYYAMTKRQFEEWGRFFAEQGKVRFLNVVLEYMFGENDNAGKFSEMIFDKLINNEGVISLTAGTQRRDFIYIRDVVNAYRVIINNLDNISQNYCDIGLGSGKAVEVREFIEMAKRIAGAETRLDFGVIPYRAHEQMFSQADTSVLQSFGWRAEHPLEQAIRNCIQGKRK